MSQRTLKRPTTEALAPADNRSQTIQIGTVADVLSQMTPSERARAYRNGTFSRAELMRAVALEPERLPTINGEFEWVAPSLADHLD